MVLFQKLYTGGSAVSGGVLQVLDVSGGHNWEPNSLLALAAALKGMQQLSKLHIPELCNADVPAIEELIGVLASRPQLDAISLSLSLIHI